MHYLALLFDTEDGPQSVPGTPEFEADVVRYVAFEEAAGAAVVGGVALYPSSTAVSIPARDLVTDGPFVETAEVIGGAFVLEADDLDVATDLARRIPVATHGWVELWPMAEFHEEPGPSTDWWMATIFEPPADAQELDTPEWTEGTAEHERFGREHGAALRGWGALLPPSTATTVRVRDDRLLLTDGPFLETAEIVNGYYHLAAPDEESAAAVAARIPVGPRGRIELRRVVDLSEQ